MEIRTNNSSVIAALNERVVELETQVQNQAYLKDRSYERENILTQKNLELIRQRFRNYNDEEYIIFFDDGDDHPESMSAPVVMSADKFRELFDSRLRIVELEKEVIMVRDRLGVALSALKADKS